MIILWREYIFDISLKQCLIVRYVFLYLLYLTYMFIIRSLPSFSMIRRCHRLTHSRDVFISLICIVNGERALRLPSSLFFQQGLIFTFLYVSRDAVIMKKGSTYTKLSELPAGSIIGTSSLRRSAQLKANYPGLVFRVSFLTSFFYAI